MSFGSCPILFIIYIIANRINWKGFRACPLSIMLDLTGFMWYHKNTHLHSFKFFKGGVAVSRTIYLILAHTGTMWSRLIKFINGYEYSHVMLSLDENLDKMYSFGRKRYNNPILAGFVCEDKDGEFFTKFSKTRCRVYKITIDEIQYFRLVRLLELFEHNREKYKYDIAGVVLRFFHLPMKRQNHYICTQFVASMLSRSGIYNIGKSFEKALPQDFENIAEEGCQENIYEGLLRNFPGRELEAE